MSEHDPDTEWLDAMQYSWPGPADPEEYVCLDFDPELEFDEDEWKRGRCFNCGAWATEIAPGEFECVCGDIWNIYEPPPGIP